MKAICHRKLSTKNRVFDSSDEGIDNVLRYFIGDPTSTLPLFRGQITIKVKLNNNIINPLKTYFYTFIFITEVYKIYTLTFITNKKMKLFFTYLIVLFTCLSLSSFRGNPTKLVAKFTSSKLAFFSYSIHNGKWSGSKEAPEKVLFISDVKVIECENVNDCQRQEALAKENFQKVLGTYEVDKPTIQNESSSMRSDAEAVQESTINNYRSNNYKIVKIN